VKAKHRAILADERGQLISPLFKFSTSRAELERVYALACQGLAQDEPLAVVLEATDIAWYPVATFSHQRGATVYVVNPHTAADLARFYQRHARSDRLSAQTLARLPVVNPEHLYHWVPPGAVCLALKRGCQELERLTEQASAIQNRLQSTDQLGWPALQQRVFTAPFSSAARWFREHFYASRCMVGAGISGLQTARLKCLVCADNPHGTVIYAVPCGQGKLLPDMNTGSITHYARSCQGTRAAGVSVTFLREKRARAGYGWPWRRQL